MRSKRGLLRFAIIIEKTQNNYSVFVPDLPLAVWSLETH